MSTSNSASGAATVTDGFTPCWYVAPSTGIYGVRFTGATGGGQANTASIDSLYRVLESLEASPVVTLNRAVAVWKLRGAGAALEMVDPLKSELDAYFYFHGLRGTLLRELGRRDEARLALTRAIALANSVAEARLIRRELDRLTAS